MSNFEDNPFGEPLFDNPFADPAVQQVAKNTSNVQSQLEDYNPFEQQQQNRMQSNTSNPIAGTHLTGDSGVGSTTTPVPPIVAATPTAVNVNNAKNANMTSHTQITPQDLSELQRRQEELDRKAAELDRREQQLQGNIPRLNNWPPLPEKCCFQPCFYQDINVDIPSEFQRVVRTLYYLWMFYTLTMLVNVIGGLICLIYNGEITTFGLSILYGFLFTPASYLCWFRPAYKAFRSDSSFNFMVFFFVYFFQLMISIFQTIGLPNTGYCGFIKAISYFISGDTGGIFVGILLLLVAICFTLCSVGNLLLITKVHAIYRSSGASMAKAQAEFTSEFMRNQHVQQAAASAMSSAVNSQLNNRY